MPDAPTTLDDGLTTRDWVRGWAAVAAVVGAMIGVMIWLLTLVQCGCTTRPPA